MSRRSHRATALAAFAVATLILGAATACTSDDEEQVSAGVDLAIGTGGWAGRFEPIDPFKPEPEAARFGRRPGVLVAWRNSNQIENIEVLVRNLGGQRGTGTLTIDLINAVTGESSPRGPGLAKNCASMSPRSRTVATRASSTTWWRRDGSTT